MSKANVLILKPAGLFCLFSASVEQKLKTRIILIVSLRGSSYTGTLILDNAGLANVGGELSGWWTPDPALLQKDNGITCSHHNCSSEKTQSWSNQCQTLEYLQLSVSFSHSRSNISDIGMQCTCKINPVTRRGWITLQRTPGSGVKLPTCYISMKM